MKCEVFNCEDAGEPLCERHRYEASVKSCIWVCSECGRLIDVDRSSQWYSELVEGRYCPFCSEDEEIVAHWRERGIGRDDL